MSQLLAIDVSNTQIGLALWPSGALAAVPGGRDASAADRGEARPQIWHIASDAGRTPDEYRILIARLFAEQALAPAEVSACVMACVVPELEAVLVETCRRLFGVEPLRVGAGVKSGLKIETAEPRELGPDRIANAVAARARHGSPVIVLDFSTALTLDVVGPGGGYLGAIIAPGIEIAAEALARHTAGLRRPGLTAPEHAIGRGTDEGLRSGLVLGYLGLVEGLLRQVQAEIGPAAVVATGDGPWLGPLLAETRAIDAHEPDLTLEGLRRIYRHHQGLDPAAGPEGRTGAGIERPAPG